MSELPKSWLLVSLDKLGKVEWGNTSITKKSYVENGVVAFSATGPDGFLPEAEWFGPGIVVSAIGANCGKCFYADGKWATIKNTIVFQSNEEFVLSKFLYYQLDGQRNWYISGSGQPFITLKTAREKEVVLPPLNEQKRIVAKIEELFSELDKGIESLKTARAQLKIYRQAVLKSAFEGKLTADWREKNGETQEWLCVPVSELLAVPLSNGRSVKDRPGGFPVLRLTALHANTLDLNEYKEGDWELHDAEPYLVVENDFFLARGNGSKHLVGIGKLAVNINSQVAFPDTMIRLRFNASLINTTFFCTDLELTHNALSN